ncbi:hypothetical protein LWI28_028549 [Acer negundo]|uniref:Uncharacterized protein n=1 Tax=Acer negundo TaxID=4023 RepID=A0AAD5NRQ4_ACENE|nr:hypothetical protein LWI28_028549 [Acer negundo]
MSESFDSIFGCVVVKSLDRDETPFMGMDALDSRVALKALIFKTRKRVESDLAADQEALLIDRVEIIYWHTWDPKFFNPDKNRAIDYFLAVEQENNKMDNNNDDVSFDFNKLADSLRGSIPGFDSMDCVFTRPGMIKEIMFDIMTLENQLPIFILDDMFKLANPAMPSQRYEGCSLRSAGLLHISRQNMEGRVEATLFQHSMDRP